MIKTIGLKFADRAYKINPEFKIICEIEDELGSINKLLEKFSNNNWQVSELVTLVHILLESAGRSLDYMALGDQIIKEGLNSYLIAVQKFLSLALNKK